MFKRVKKFSKDESGAAMAEYAILVGLIAVIAIGAVTAVGTDVTNVFTKISTELKKLPN